VLGLNLARGTYYLDCGLSWFLHPLLEECGILLPLGHYCLFPNPFKFVIHGTYLQTLQRLNIDSVILYPTKENNRDRQKEGGRGKEKKDKSVFSCCYK
jgi:hypothetical protein